MAYLYYHHHQHQPNYPKIRTFQCIWLIENKNQNAYSVNIRPGRWFCGSLCCIQTWINGFCQRRLFSFRLWRLLILRTGLQSCANIYICTFLMYIFHVTAQVNIIFEHRFTLRTRQLENNNNKSQFSLIDIIQYSDGIFSCTRNIFTFCGIGSSGCLRIKCPAKWCAAVFSMIGALQILHKAACTAWLSL